MFFDELRPNILDLDLCKHIYWDFKMDLGPFEIYRFFYSGLRPIALPGLLDLGPVKIQNPFVIKFETNFEYFFGSRNV